MRKSRQDAKTPGRWVSHPLSWRLGGFLILGERSVARWDARAAVAFAPGSGDAHEELDDGEDDVAGQEPREDERRIRLERDDGARRDDEEDECDGARVELQLLER